MKMQRIKKKNMLLIFVALGFLFSVVGGQTISGEITFPDRDMNFPDGELTIAVWQDVSAWPFPPMEEMPMIDILIGPPVSFENPVPYTVDDPALVTGHDYYIAAFFDEDGIEPRGDAEGWYGDNMASGQIGLEGGDVSGINIELKPWGGPMAEFSFDFGATQGYAETDFQDLDGSPEITIEMFIQLHAPFGTGGPYELFHRSEWGFLDYTGDNGTFRFQLGGIGEFTWKFSPNPGEWHHIAADYDGTNMTIYWDGDPKESIVTGGGNLPSASSPLRIGEEIDGLVDIIRISDVALYMGNSFDPWMQNYGPNINTYLLYHCNEGNGSQLIDDSGFNHHATIIGNPTWSNSTPLGPMGVGLWISDVGMDFVELHWDRWPDPDNEFVKYEIRRTEGAALVDLESPIVLTETDVNVTSWQDDTVTEGNEYRYKMWMYDQVGPRFETGEMVVIPGPAIRWDVIVQRGTNGQMYHTLWYPGKDWEVDSPDRVWGPFYESFGSSGDRRSYGFEGLQRGDGYTLISFLDQDGSPNRGPDNCDQNEDLMGGIFNLSVQGIEQTEITIDECDQFVSLPPPPEITGNVSQAPVTANTDVVVSVQIQSEAGIKQADLFYLIGGNQTPKTSAFSNVGGDNYEATIPAADVTNRGLVGFIKAEDNENQVTFSDTAEIRVEFGEIGMITTAKKNYIMISAPGDLDDNNQLSVLDELGKYDKTVYRLFRWNGSSYSEYEGSATFNQGIAFWIVTKDAVELKGGAGTSTTLIPPATITLSQGWNQVGNPYTFNVDLSQTEFPPGAIESTVYEWTGTSYTEGTQFKPGKGYWVYAYENTSIRLAVVPGSLQRQAGTNSYTEWSGRILASINRVKDTENIFGVSSVASDTWDEYDRHEPPVIGDYITLAFDNRDWEFRGGMYGRDIRSAEAEGYTWPFVVQTNQEGYVHLNFEWFETFPVNWEVYVIDNTLGIVQDIRIEPEYSFISDGAETIRKLVLVMGSADFAAESIAEYNVIPQRYSLDQNMPNPFNARTTIRFSLPEENQVSLVIYDLLGHEVITLVSRKQFDSGIHAFVWNGTDHFGREISTGIYIYRLTAWRDKDIKFQNARKLILLK